MNCGIIVSPKGHCVAMSLRIIVSYLFRGIIVSLRIIVSYVCVIDILQQCLLGCVVCVVIVIVVISLCIVVGSFCAESKDQPFTCCHHLLQSQQIFADSTCCDYLTEKC